VSRAPAVAVERTAVASHARAAVERTAAGADARIVVGVALLLARLLVGPGPGALPMLAATYAAILALCVAPGDGSLLPLPARGRRSARALGWPVAAGLGLAAVGLAVAVGGPAPAPAAAVAVGPALLGSAAAVAEEALFRGLVYRRLEAFGSVAAMVGSAALFAAVHVPAYGPGVLPLDLAAGLLFAWQRRATGGLAAPTVTHVVANLLAVAR
jgi:uncharacterized protein